MRATSAWAGRAGAAAALGLALSAAFSCGTPGGEAPDGFDEDDLPPAADAGPGADAGGAADGGETGAGTPDAGPSEADLLEPRITGFYASRVTVATIATLPPFGTESRGSTTTLQAAWIRRDGDGFVLAERPCRATPSDSGLQIPDRLTRSIGDVAAPLVLRADAGGHAVLREQTVVVLGAVLASPATDPLPVRPGPPEADTDGDGKPGVTVRKTSFPSGDMYVAQRQKTSYLGRLARDGRVEGQVSQAVEQKVLDATNPLLKTDVPTRQDPDLSKSTVLLVRQPAELTCDEIVARGAALFEG